MRSQRLPGAHPQLRGKHGIEHHLPHFVHGVSRACRKLHKVFQRGQRLAITHAGVLGLHERAAAPPTRNQADVLQLPQGRSHRVAAGIEFIRQLIFRGDGRIHCVRAIGDALGKHFRNLAVKRNRGHRCKYESG